MQSETDFDVPQGGHTASPCFSKAGPWLLCSHPELVCTLLEGPAPQPPCHRGSHSRPDPQIKAGAPGQGCYQSRDTRHRRGAAAKTGRAVPGRPCSSEGSRSTRAPQRCTGPGCSRGTGALGSSGISALQPRDVLALLLSPSAALGDGQQLASRGNCQAASNTQAAKAL